MKLLSTTVLLAALTPALCLNAAHAESSATASISVSKLTLIDTDLEDGIAPYLRMHFGDDWRPVQASTSYATGANVQSQSVSQQWAWSPLSVQQSIGDSLQSSATLSGSSLAALSASASVRADASSGVDTAQASVSTSLTPRYFSLAPNTLLSITFDVDLASSSGDGAFATSSADISFWTRCYIRTCDGKFWSLGLTDRADGSGSIGGQTTSKQFTGYLISYDEPLSFNLSYDVRASVSPVPEPQTYAMLLAGLALCGASGWRARRRRSA